MIATAEKLELPPANIRRFEEPDLCTHGAWIMKRLQERYPHQNDRALATYLRGLFASNEYLFLYQDHAVGLAQVVRMYTLESTAIVQERFVWAQDPKNALHIAAAASFYDEFHRWASSMQVSKIMVEEWSDVPHEKIREKLGRLFTMQSVFARV